MYQFYIWGAGVRGQRILHNLGRDRVLGFIDQSTSLQQSGFDGVPVLSFEQYIKKGDSHYIIITPLDPAAIFSITSLLESHSIYRYFLMDDCPPHLYSGHQCFTHLNEIFSFSRSQTVVFYGISLYTALALEYFQEKGVQQLFVVPQNECSAEQYQCFLRSFGNFYAPPTDFNGKIFLMLSEMQTEAQEKFPYAIFEDALLLSANAIMQPLTRLQKFQNNHRGQRCFIVATGPSVRVDDLNLLYRNHECCISVNHIYKIFDQTQWRPDYYICVDSMLIKDYQEELDTLDAHNKFIATSYPPFWQNSHDDHTYPFTVAYYKYCNNPPPFSSNFSEGVFEGFSITYPSIQFAVYAGFSEIYLIGCDHNYVAPQAGAAGNHFIKDYQGKKLNTPVYQKDKVELAYRSARQYCDAHGIHIYNATRGGKLEVFDRVDFDSLFD